MCDACFGTMNQLKICKVCKKKAEFEESGPDISTRYFCSEKCYEAFVKPLYAKGLFWRTNGLRRISIQEWAEEDAKKFGKYAWADLDGWIVLYRSKKDNFMGCMGDWDPHSKGCSCKSCLIIENVKLKMEGLKRKKGMMNGQKKAK